MKAIITSVIFLGLIAVTTQEIIRKNGCDCSTCKSPKNSINVVGSKKIQEQDKSSCNFCKQRREMLRLENEKLQQLQKCPFEILGSPALKGKTSAEIFDEFRELIVPSQNGFFDLMRGIVKTMHVSSETELKWALEKEAKERKNLRKEEKENEKGKETEHIVVVNQKSVGKDAIKHKNIPNIPYNRKFTEEAGIASQKLLTAVTDKLQFLN